MKTIYEYLLGKTKTKLSKDNTWEEFYDSVSDVKKETETKLISLFTKHFPDSFGGYLIELLNGLNDNGFDFKIGDGEQWRNWSINKDTKLVKLEASDEDWDTVSLYVTIYDVPKHNAIMIAYDNYYKTITVYFVHQKDDESMIEFCDMDQWEETDMKLRVKVKHSTEESINKFEKLLNEMK